ncbi:glutamate--tRNA ligase [Flavobacterium sp. Fl-77]|uniref:Glutamate--tRNA ligase n=1 Tax=Flavobacterium flavipigmentatum TaxID=2893884 RepID=A0AAJ2W004_9FLAO|nr:MULTISPECIES: glutamate--tRNA ligase [unclassified Flavobacterium]MDX6180954.1 glutamate--tRNA ligase [Flavobacterium sp. Fl-33]MDX6184555.1 glutamate--tRNA ligase [Flavobacterium sp. Fl-77]UFH39660.1 glutamate--tRNA ligase [Flavobacterium sp. F-70]
MSKQVRVRFAPSPTGPLHIGGVRTALFNYLFAKKNNGVFYLRIEDTDQTRFVSGAEAYIMEALEWLGIAPDETVGKNEKFGPYRQSDRKHLYQTYADQLINSGWAYYAFDTPETLDALRKEQEAEGKTFIYNHTIREKLDTSLVISAEEVAKRITNGEHYVIRFKTPVDETLHLKDIIRGDVKFETSLLDDKVLFKSDGMPTYHLANIVDDHLMETSHVIRGEEWLPSMPLHVLLYRAFGWDAPEFAHLPLILKPIGNGKLSKRDGDKLGFPVFPLEWKTEEGISSGYRENGFFPEGVINFLALLGWNDGTDKELFSLEELVEAFDLNRVHKSGAKFDPEKNKWFNHQYLIKQNNEELAKDFTPTLTEKGVDISKFDITRIVSLIKERAHFVSEFWDLTDFFFQAPTSYDEKASKNWKEETPTLMQELISVLENIEDFTSANIETIVKDWMTKNEIGMGKVMQPFRLSLVGALKGPHLFDIVEIIGKEETISRIQKAISTL